MPKTGLEKSNLRYKKIEEKKCLSILARCFLISKPDSISENIFLSGFFYVIFFRNYNDGCIILAAIASTKGFGTGYFENPDNFDKIINEAKEIIAKEKDDDLGNLWTALELVSFFNQNVLFTIFFS